MEVNENYFMFNHIRYRVEEVKENDRSKCSKCAFREHRECDYWSDIPECSKACRKDGRSVVFVEAKRNFEKITASPESLAAFIMNEMGVGGECTLCPVDDCDGDGDCILLFKDWLEKEVEE